MEENLMREDRERQAVFDMGGLRLAFWGLLFTAINIRIQGFDLVPDVIGYIMVISGLRKIQPYEEKFTKAKKLAYVLTVLSLINIYQAPFQEASGQSGMAAAAASDSINFSAGILGSNPWLASILMTIGFFANIYFAYFMCMGMRNLLNQVGDFTLAGICDDRWKLILGAEIGLIVSLILVMLRVPFGTIMTMIFGVLALIALVLFLLLIHHASRSIHGKPDRSFVDPMSGCE